jgi:tubulin---tyrosine ligase
VHNRLSGLSKSGPQDLSPSCTPKLYAIVDYPDPYVQPLIIKALSSQLQGLSLELISSSSQLPSPKSPLLQFTAYESLDFEHALEHPKSSLICAYVIRKALIRKHYLSNTISGWLVKHPNSSLRRHFKPAVHFELDYAEFLDEALADAWDLNESMQRNETLGGEYERKEWWILKPGMSDGGNGIRLFSSLKQLQDIFQGWEEDTQDEGDIDGIAEETEDLDQSKGHAPASGTMTSQLRHFIVQPYIDPPLLLPTKGNRKFHIRVYVLAVGALKVYVFKEMLALFAAKAYQSPCQLQDEKEIDLSSHLTNTCFQDSSVREESVARFWDLEDVSLDTGWKENIFEQICECTGEVFEAAAREQMVHFQTLPNALELYGADFLVDAGLEVSLLEFNAYPDFKQSGQRFQEQIVGRLFSEVVKTSIQPYFSEQAGGDGLGGGDMVLVKKIDLGRR